MRRIFAGLVALLFFFVAPGTVAGLVPWSIGRNPSEGMLLLAPATWIIGVVLIAAGLVPISGQVGRKRIR